MNTYFPDSRIQCNSKSATKSCNQCYDSDDSFLAAQKPTQIWNGPWSLTFYVTMTNTTFHMYLEALCNSCYYAIIWSVPLVKFAENTFQKVEKTENSMNRKSRKPGEIFSNYHHPHTYTGSQMRYHSKLTAVPKDALGGLFFQASQSSAILNCMIHCHVRALWPQGAVTMVSLRTTIIPPFSLWLHQAHYSFKMPDLRKITRRNIICQEHIMTLVFCSVYEGCSAENNRSSM